MVEYLKEIKEELGPLKVILVSSPPMDGNRETFSVSELDAAATKLQKVYKGYRNGRNLADAAVVVEELWFVIAPQKTHVMLCYTIVPWCTRNPLFIMFV